MRTMSWRSLHLELQNAGDVVQPWVFQGEGCIVKPASIQESPRFLMTATQRRGGVNRKREGKSSRMRGSGNRRGGIAVGLKVESDSPHSVDELRRTPDGKIVIDWSEELKVRRKPDPPPFICTLCGETKEDRRGDLAWGAAGACLCIQCYRELWGRRRNKNYWRFRLTWNDKNDFELAGYLAGALEREARRVRR